MKHNTPTMEELFPSLTPEERGQAEIQMKAYLELAGQIYNRVVVEVKAWVATNPDRAHRLAHLMLDLGLWERGDRTRAEAVAALFGKPNIMFLLGTTEEKRVLMSLMMAGATLKDKKLEITWALPFREWYVPPTKPIWAKTGERLSTDLLRDWEAPFEVLDGTEVVQLKLEL